LVLWIGVGFPMLALLALDVALYPGRVIIAVMCHLLSLIVEGLLLIVEYHVRTFASTVVVFDRPN
jgi:hypothetical protein